MPRHPGLDTGILHRSLPPRATAETRRVGVLADRELNSFSLMFRTLQPTIFRAKRGIPVTDTSRYAADGVAQAGSGRSLAGWFPTGAPREEACGGGARKVRHNQLQGAGVLRYPLSQRMAGASRFRNVRGGAEPARHVQAAQRCCLYPGTQIARAFNRGGESRLEVPCPELDPDVHARAEISQAVIDALRPQEAPIPDQDRERRRPLAPEHLARTGPLTHLPSIHDGSARPSRPVARLALSAACARVPGSRLWTVIRRGTGMSNPWYCRHKDRPQARVA